MTKTRTEEFKINGEELLGKVKQLINEGNVRRIVIKNKEGKNLGRPLVPKVTILKSVNLTLKVSHLTLTKKAMSSLLLKTVALALLPSHLVKPTQLATMQRCI